MNLIYKENTEGVDWNLVPSLLQKVEMSFVEASKHKISFENSWAVVFVYDNDKMIGFGRSISDGIRQSALYDIAIDSDYQGYGIGRGIIERLIRKTPECNFILYASPGKEGFYQKIGFSKMKTGMALFLDPKKMLEKGFIE